MYKAILIPIPPSSPDNAIIFMGTQSKEISMSEQMKAGDSIIQSLDLIIISDEKVRKNDWYIYPNQKYIQQCIIAPVDPSNCLKIIASTNSSHNLPGITTESIQEWIDAGCPEEIELMIERVIENYKAGICPPWSDNISTDTVKRLEKAGYYTDCFKLTNNQVTLVIPEKKAQWENKVFQATPDKKGISNDVIDFNEEHDIDKRDYIVHIEPDVEQLAEEAFGKLVNPNVDFVDTSQFGLDMFKAGWEACKKHYNVK